MKGGGAVGVEKVAFFAVRGAEYRALE